MGQWQQHDLRGFPPEQRSCLRASIDAAPGALFRSNTRTVSGIRHSSNTFTLECVAASTTMRIVGALSTETGEMRPHKMLIGHSKFHVP